MKITNITNVITILIFVFITIFVNTISVSSDKVEWGRVNGLLYSQENRLTETVINKLLDHKTNVHIVKNMDLETFIGQEADTSQGWCKYDDENVIYVEDNVDNREMEKILYHELGHSFDKVQRGGYIYTSFSLNDDFIEIYNKEKDILFDENNSYYKSTSTEYFAETFSMYFYSEETREELKEKAPMTYVYIEIVTK